MLKQFLENRDSVLAYIRLLTGDTDAAEEIFQEVALAIAREDQRGTEVQHFLAWAREVARRRVAEYFRNEARRNKQMQLRESLADVIDQAFAENESVLDQHKERLKLLEECLALLQGRAKQVVQLRYRDEKTNPQMASILDWTVESVAVTLSRARKSLAECVERRLRLQGAD